MKKGWWLPTWRAFRVLAMIFFGFFCVTSLFSNPFGAILPGILLVLLYFNPPGKEKKNQFVTGAIDFWFNSKNDAIDTKPIEKIEEKKEKRSKDIFERMADNMWDK